MVALFRFSIWRLDVVVNMRKILNFLKERMQAEGMTNKQICEQLGIAKATFYLKMKEYRQNS